jgi:hypothetical protein
MPPLPADWEVRPTHPVHSVPYYLASLWDAKMAEEARQDTLRKRATDAKGEDNCTIGRVPKALKAKLKKSRGAKGLLQDLEHEVRKFVETWEEKERKLAKYETFDGDSEDDEIVFVPNNALLHSRDNSFDFMDDHYREKLVFDGPDEDRAASFGYVPSPFLVKMHINSFSRWLVHNLGLYYGLETWSVTVGNPPRREAYVGIRDVKLKQNRRASPSSMLPRPLWAMV